MIGGIALQAEGIAGELRQRFPAQRKTQRGKLALLVATMLHARTANLMALAASLPLSTERADMRYQWIARFIDNERVVCDSVMEPFGREVLAKAAEAGRVTLIMDQTVKQRPIVSREQHPKVSSWSGRFWLFFALFEAVRVVAGFQDVAVVGDAIQQRCGHFGISKH
jgi:hypothetical protein